MPSVNLFTPSWNGTIKIIATSGAAITTALTTATGCSSVRIKNVSATNVAFVALGTTATSVATVTGGMPIGLGETVGVTRDPNTQLYASAVVAADTATVYFTVGDGE